MSEHYIGEIRMFSGNYAPQGWALCNGQVLSISENELLYALIGTTYGGDGRATFALPDLRGRIGIHQGKNPNTNTSYPIGQKGGTDAVTLTTATLPSHTHNVNVFNTEGSQPDPTNAFWAKGNPQYSNASPNNQMNSSLISTVGGNQPHDNVMPFLSINYIIALQGLFPPQS